MWASDRGDCQRQPKSDQLSAKPPVDTGSFFRRRRHERGVQLYPCGIATVTPQIFTVASWPVVTSRPEVPQPGTAGRRVRTATSPYPPDLSWWAVKRRQTLISRVHLLISLTGPTSSGSADTSRRCQGCSHPHQRPLDQAAPSFHPAAATTRQRRSLTSIRLQTPRGARGFRPNRSRRTLSRNAPLSSLSVIEPSWSMRRTNGRTLRSDTRSAVHDPSAPQGPRPSTSAVQEWPRVIRRDAPCGWLDSRIVGPRQPAPARTRRPARHPPGARSSHRLSTAVEN